MGTTNERFIFAPFRRILRRNWRPPSDEAMLPGGPDAVAWTVVTGASGGIGFELARAFAEAGRPMLLVARNAERLSQAARDLEKETGAEVHWLATDLSLSNAPRRVETRVTEAGGRIDLLINSAGIGLSGSFVTHTEDEIDQLVALNVSALTRLCRRVLPGMLAHGAGGIINVGSLAGMVPGPYQAAYYASKAYVLALSEALAEEVAGTGVRVVALAPGASETQFHDRMRSRGSLYLLMPGQVSPRRIARAARFGYAIGLRTVVPGLVPKVYAVALRVLPHSLTVPLMARLLKPRGLRGEDDAGKE